MDREQQNHLKAYGYAFQILNEGQSGEWLLNYRSGSFLVSDTPDNRRKAALLGVTVEPLTAGALARVRSDIESQNMESVPLEKAPRIAVYTPPNSSPWDDAVTMALAYAEIPYEQIWDREVLSDALDNYDWLHLHHEDFTGQYSKFYLTYASSPWLQEEVTRNETVARELGFAHVPALKRAVAQRLREYVEGGGFLFAMCTATETLELALAGSGIDIAASFADGSPPDLAATQKMNWPAAMAFQDAVLVTDPTLSAFSDIDGHQVNTPWRVDLGSYALFEFSAKFDPVPTMLTQNHQRVLPDFYGLTTTFRSERIRQGVTILAEEEGRGRVKYLHGSLGDGTFTYLGGHDPEDPRHLIGDAPTDLDLHRHSPGYRLILNNVLFPAAKKKKLKT
ncbi:MAG: asparagine synthetase B [Gemmatimonadetes bacterium]|nr:asparagine synthetase B [Gemmatimonadota bacterium]